MAIYTISDLHLSFGTDKPMNIFGGAWIDHEGQIAENWRSAVADDDTVVIPGDHSWALRTEDAEADMLFINGLPGTKILLKGNHDLWWTTSAKMKKFKDKIGADSLIFMYNDCIPVRSSGKLYAIAGTRGWLCPGDSEYKPQTDEKIYVREAGRLKSSLDKARALLESIPYSERGEIIVFMHYPPFGAGGRSGGEATLFTDIIDSCNVRKCYYGHLHGFTDAIRAEKRHTDIRFTSWGAEYSLVSCDYTGNKLIKAAD